MTDTYEYDAFGNEINHTGTTPNNYLYRGEQWDPDLGLYDLRARYYNPLAGRFVSRDSDDGAPADPATLHRYDYADGDPIDGFDPTGKSTITVSTPATNQITDETSGSPVEYGLILGIVSTGAIAGEKYLACALNIRNSITALEVDGSTNVTPDLTNCSAKKVKEKCTEAHPEWPVNFVEASKTPLIAAHIASAQAGGAPDALTYNGKDSEQTDENRAKACPRGKYANLKMSCDEYPYASTRQGGETASTAPVPINEQRIQGGQLRWFYEGLGAGQNFCVEVVP